SDWKEFGCYVRAHVSDSCCILILGLRNESSFCNVAILDVDAVCGRAGNKNIFEDFVIAFDLDWSASRSRANLTDERRALFQIVVVLQGQLFIATLSCGNSVSVFKIFERVEALDGKRFRSDSGNLLVDVTIEAGD